MVSFTYLIYTGNMIDVTSQNHNKDTSIISLDSATISTSYFTTCLDVSYTCYAGDWRARFFDFEITLFLSLDNMSWIEVETIIFNDRNWWTNVSGSFQVFNSLGQAFPFDIEQGVTLYICVEFYDPFVLTTGSPGRTRSNTLAIIVPIEITRPWYYVIDWTIPVVFGVIFLSLFAIFLVSRYNMKRIEKELRAKIKNEEQ